MTYNVSTKKPHYISEPYGLPPELAEKDKFKNVSKQKRMTIYDIKRETAETEPYFFKHNTMKFFHQKLSDFSVYKLPNGKYKIVAPMKDHDGRFVGYTKRIYNPETKELEMTE